MYQPPTSWCSIKHIQDLMLILQCLALASICVASVWGLFFSFFKLPGLSVVVTSCSKSVVLPPVIMNTMTSMKGGSYFGRGQDVLSNPRSLHPSSSDYLTRHLYEALAKKLYKITINQNPCGWVAHFRHCHKIVAEHLCLFFRNQTVKGAS